MRLPDPPQPGHPILPWARRLLAALRSQKLTAGPGITLRHTPQGTTIATQPTSPKAPKSPSHPWQATPTGTANIAIAPGCVVGYMARDVAEALSDYGFNWPFYGVHVKYQGGTVAIPPDSENGVIYYTFTAASSIAGYYKFPDDEGIIHMSFLHRPSPYIGTLVFGPITPNTPSMFLDPDFSLPESGTIYIPIAEVSIDEGVAKVDYQILTHNPHIWLTSPWLQTSPT